MGGAIRLPVLTRFMVMHYNTTACSRWMDASASYTFAVSGRYAVGTNILILQSFWAATGLNIAGPGRERGGPDLRANPATTLPSGGRPAVALGPVNWSCNPRSASKWRP